MKQPYASKVLLNLKKAKGQLALLEKMVAEDRYCVDIGQQVNATIGLLKKINNTILENHLLSCGAKKLNSKNLRQRSGFAQELIQAFSITNK